MPFFGKKKSDKSPKISKGPKLPPPSPSGGGRAQRPSIHHSDTLSNSKTQDGPDLVNGDIGVSGSPMVTQHGGARPKTLLLHAFSEADTDPGDAGTGFLKAETPMQTSSRLSKTLWEVLHDKEALPYFIQYMDWRGAEHIIKFWLDAESFQASSWTRIRTHSLNSLSRSSVGSKGRSESGSSSVSPPSTGVPSSTDLMQNGNKPKPAVVHFEESSTSQGQSSQDTARSSAPDRTLDNSSVAASESCQVIEQKDTLSEKVVESSPAGVVLSERGSLCGQNTNSDNAAGIKPSVEGGTGNHGNCGNVNTVHMKTSNSGVCQSNAGSGGLETDNHRTNGEQSSSGNASPVMSPREDAFQEKLRKSIERDAVNIYAKYISLDATHPIGISDSLRNEAISKICREDGQVDPQCFVDCQDFTCKLMEREYFPGFLQSEFHCKHQIDILTGSQVFLADVLYNEVAMFYFMEFMEQVGATSLLHFWLSADNFRQHLSTQPGPYDGMQAQNDAMVLYEKYFSLQASSPLGFDDKVRFEVESNICREGGPLPDCFASPMKIVFRTMEKGYFAQFLQSELYLKYLSELINTVQSQDIPQPRRKRTGSDASSEHSVGSHSTGSESVSSKNTLLAADSSQSHLKKALNKIHVDMRIDSMLLNPDALWKRPQAGKMSLGHINEIGQFVSEFDPEPDHEKKRKGTSFFKKRKDKEKAQEDMALQIAQMIINDVTTVTQSADEDEDAPNISQP